MNLEKFTELNDLDCVILGILGSNSTKYLLYYYIFHMFPILLTIQKLIQ